MKLIAGKHLAPFTLLPSKTGTCPECAIIHDKDLPHNQQSLFYQYHFYNQHGRWPNWGDAMAHCSEKMQETWKQELRKSGVKDSEFINNHA